MFRVSDSTRVVINRYRARQIDLVNLEVTVTNLKAIPRT